MTDNQPDPMPEQGTPEWRHEVLRLATEFEQLADTCDGESLFSVVAMGAKLRTAAAKLRHEAQKAECQSGCTSPDTGADNGQ